MDESFWERALLGPFLFYAKNNSTSTPPENLQDSADLLKLIPLAFFFFWSHRDNDGRLSHSL